METFPYTNYPLFKDMRQAAKGFPWGLCEKISYCALILETETKQLVLAITRIM